MWHMNVCTGGLGGGGHEKMPHLSGVYGADLATVTKSGLPCAQRYFDRQSQIQPALDAASPPLIRWHGHTIETNRIHLALFGMRNRMFDPNLAAVHTTETNSIHLVLFDMNSRMFGPSLAAIHRTLVPIPTNKPFPASLP
jgi:hypothetical protein